MIVYRVRECRFEDRESREAEDIYVKLYFTFTRLTTPGSVKGGDNEPDWASLVGDIW